MSASLGLYRLQIVDSRMDEIRARLEQIRQTLENDEQLKAATSQFVKKEDAHKEALKALKQTESEVEKQKVKIEQSESSLYSGSVKNPKELQDLQNEVASLKRYLITLEDRQLEAMLAEEEAEETLQAASDAVKNVQKHLEAQNENLTEEKRTLDKEMERLNAERDAALGPLDASLLAVYDNLRQQRRGVAVAKVSEGACAACGATLTASQQQNAHSTSQIYNCPTCGRILYAN